MRRCAKEKLYISDHFQETVRKYPDKVAILFEERKMTFKELDELSNKIANLLLATNVLLHGDSMAIFMENCPEFIAVYLALSKIGVTGAFINHNLRGQGLAHCIRVSHCSGVFFSCTLSEAMSEVLPELEPSMSQILYSVGGDSCISEAKTLANAIKAASPATPPLCHRKSANGAHFYNIKLYFLFCIIVHLLVFYNCMCVVEELTVCFTSLVSYRSGLLHLHLWNFWSSQSLSHQTQQVYTQLYK